MKLRCVPILFAGLALFAVAALTGCAEYSRAEVICDANSHLDGHCESCKAQCHGASYGLYKAIGRRCFCADHPQWTELVDGQAYLPLGRIKTSKTRNTPLK